MSSFGQTSRRPPPAKPQPTAKGSAPNSPATSAGSATSSADERAGVGTGDEAGEERAFERQVGGVVVEQQARRRRRPSAARRGRARRPGGRASRAARRSGCAGTGGSARASSPAPPSTASLTTSVVSRNCSGGEELGFLEPASCGTRARLQPVAAECVGTGIRYHDLSMIRPLINGFATTFKHMFKPPITVNYPDQKVPMFPKYRGKQVLMRDENGLEKCVACGLCAVACPADAIYLEAAENDGTVHGRSALRVRSTRSTRRAASSAATAKRPARCRPSSWARTTSWPSTARTTSSGTRRSCSCRRPRRAGADARRSPRRDR